jgi:hypothetical protein
MNRALRKKLAKLFSGKVSLIAGPRLNAADRTAFVQHTARPLPDPADNHALIVGGTRKGKSGLLQLMAQSSLANPQQGLTAIDPHGEFVRAVRDWCANPDNDQYRRRLHYLDTSSVYTFGLNPLRIYDASWEACHDAAVGLASVIESRFEASPEETPRLARIVYVAAMLCARHGLTMLELVELLSIGGDELRRSLLQDFDNRIVARELEDLHALAIRSPREFLALVESTKNRFVRWLGDRRLARVLGQKNGLDPLAVMDGADIVLADFSSLTYADAALLGCLISSMYFAAARRRPPLQGPRHRLILDEAESLITLDVARMCDQSAKHGLLLTAAIQRLGQLRARGDFVADALLTNCALKICFGGLEHDSARYMAETLFPGHLNLAEWKPGSERPTAVGNDKVTLRNRSRSSHYAEHVGSAVSHVRSSGRMLSSSDASIAAWGSAFSQGSSASFASTPPDALLTTTPLSQNAGSNSARSLSTSGGRSRARSIAQHAARATGTTIVRARAHGESLAEGEHEAMVTRYEELPSAMYTLEEQLHRATALLMNLPRRECVIKLEGQAPYLTRTPDLTPAFKSEEFKAEILPRYIETTARRSPYLVPADTIDGELATRAKQLTAPPPPTEPDFAAPEPTPTILDAPDAYAREFHKRRGKPKTAKSPKTGNAKRERFRVIDGGADDGDNKS